MTIQSKEKGNRSFYEECMYVASNYYVFKKRPKTKIRPLSPMFFRYMILCLVLAIVCLFFSSTIIFSPMLFFSFAIELYLWIEARYRLRECLKGEDSIISITKDGIQSTQKGNLSIQMSWDSIEYVIIHNHSISVLPYSFAGIMIFIEIHSKDELLKALKKYDKLSLVVDNSKK